MTVAITAIEPSDQAEWRRLWTAYLEFYDTQVVEAVYETTFGRLCSAQDGEFSGFIARLNGRAVGIAHYLFHRHCWRVENACYLQDLFVDASVRGGGVGRALIEAVYAAADAAGSPSVYWLTQTHNVTARRLYDRIGVATDLMRYQRN